MDFTFSEKDKKMLAIVMVLIFGFGIFQFVISPMKASIGEKTKKYEELKPKYEEMKKLVDDKTVKIKYEKAKQDSKENFEKTYKSFIVDEKIASIAEQQGVKIRSLNISFGYEKISQDDYTSNILQPPTTKEKDSDSDVDTANLDLFLVNKINISLEGSYKQILNFIDAINNVPPIGLGADEIQRYCLQIPSTDWSTVDAGGVFEKSFSINLYGMEAPPEN